MNTFSNRALYLQVRDAMAVRIVGREWEPGTMIPNETKLARELGVSPGTMRKALDLLEGEGLVTRRQGRGTFVNDPTVPMLANRYNKIRGLDGEHIVGDIKTLEVTEGPANEEECVRLRLETGAVYRIKRSRAHNGKPYVVETAILPEAMFPRLAETFHFSDGNGIVAIAHAYGILLGEAIERASLGAASRPSAEALNIVAGTPVFVLDRIIKTRNGCPAEWRLAECTMAGMHYEVETHNWKNRV